MFNHLRGTHGYGRQEATLALQAQGIHNVAPFAIRAAIAEAKGQRATVTAPLQEQADAETPGLDPEGTSEVWQGLTPGA